MDRRLHDFADLVGRLLAKRWYELQQEKKRSRDDQETSLASDKKHGPRTADPS